MNFDTGVSLISFWPIINFLFVSAGLVLGIYCLVLFIQLAKRGIDAFEIYIDKNKGM